MKSLKTVFLFLCFSIYLSGIISADDWKCKCILCLSNPGGPKQFEECVPAIEKLERHLRRGGSFPICQGAQEAGVTTERGYEPCMTCAEAYGSRWQLKTKLINDGTGENEHWVRIYYCRRRGKVRERVCDVADHEQDCHYEWVEKWIEKPIRRRGQPYWYELHYNGEKHGQRTWWSRGEKFDFKCDCSKSGPSKKR